MLSTDVRRLENENASLREALKMMKTQFATEQSKPRACEYCKFFIQHYVRLGNSYDKTYCGHCTHGNCKKRKPDDTCKYFEVGTYETRNVI